MYIMYRNIVLKIEVECIEENTFRCTNIPEGIEHIARLAFDDYPALKEITYRGKTRKVSHIDGWCMELVHSRKYDKYTIHKGYHFPDYETVYYVAECDGKYAHGETAKEAVRDLSLSCVRVGASSNTED